MGTSDLPDVEDKYFKFAIGSLTRLTIKVSMVGLL